MKMHNRELGEYLNRGIENIVRGFDIKSFSDIRERMFLIKFSSAVKSAEKIRKEYEDKGTHIPAFLISSITNSCNLHCKGCYARENGMCGEKPDAEKNLLSADEWEAVFAQARELGICFNLLAGGEPLTRYDVLERAGKFKEIVFPVFTNGTMIDDRYISMFDRSRNLIPIMSMEGSRASTDGRRGTGVYDRVTEIMETLGRRKILYGASITVTAENMEEVTDSEFIGALAESGCRIVFFVEYVPVDEGTRALAFTDRERTCFEMKCGKLRKAFERMLFLAFPGDEEKMGGCLAAGRGFFHINPYGAAEPCPFSPYSDCTVRDCSLEEVLRSKFFRELQNEKLVGGEHVGGCALFAERARVEELLKRM